MKGVFPYLIRRENFNYFLTILLALPLYGFGQEHPLIVGARAWGMANTIIARHDYLAICNNTAGLTGIQQTTAFSSFDTYYGFEGVNSLATGIVLPITGDLGAGLVVSKLGDNIYNESSISIGAGHRIGKVSLGLKTDYLQTSINIPSLITNRHSIVLEMGGIVEFSTKFSMGAHIFNLLQANYSGDVQYRVPTMIRVGFQYIPSEEVNLSAEFNKNTDQPVQFRAGLEYRFLKKLFLRTGIASGPSVHYFGTGFAGKKIQFDYATNFHSALGISHHISMAYCFPKKHTTSDKMQ